MDKFTDYNCDLQVRKHLWDKPQKMGRLGRKGLPLNVLEAQGSFNNLLDGAERSFIGLPSQMT